MAGHYQVQYAAVAWDGSVFCTFFTVGWAMYEYGRWLVVLAVMAVMGIFTGLSVGVAQSPNETKRQQSIEEKFRQAIESGNPGQSSDPILNDLLELAGQQSLLKNSMLGKELDAMEGASSAQSRHAHAAESLLRAARRLEQIGSRDKTRQQLVKQMRSEAVKLLTEVQ